MGCVLAVRRVRSEKLRAVGATAMHWPDAMVSARGVLKDACSLWWLP